VFSALNGRTDAKDAERAEKIFKIQTLPKGNLRSLSPTSRKRETDKKEFLDEALAQ
jgi:hypothetical protein